MVSVFQYMGRRNSATLDLVGLSTDEKPIRKFKNTPVINGSTFLELDTGDKYLYDEENSTWYKKKNSGSNSGSDLDSYATTDYVDSKLSEKLDKDAIAVGAEKLSTPRDISLSGDVTSQPISFNGSNDVSISTEIDDITEEDIRDLFK